MSTDTRYVEKYGVVNRHPDAPEPIPPWNPSAGGKSQCMNAGCSSFGQSCVHPVEAVDRMFPRKNNVSFEWPVPEFVTHICTVCGFWYSGRVRGISEW